MMMGRGETQKRKLSEFLGGGGGGSRPANWPEEQETARDVSTPQLITNQIHLTAQSKQKRESECTSFVCRGRRTVEQRKKTS